jgi:hypothetical protein
MDNIAASTKLKQEAEEGQHRRIGKQVAPIVKSLKTALSDIQSRSN